MTIYLTPFNAHTRQASGLSTDSGFATLEATAEAMGPARHQTPALLIYGEGESSVLFSRTAFWLGPVALHIDTGDSTR